MDTENIAIILNSSNVVEDTGNSIYRYTFKNGDVNFTDTDKIAISSINIYNSWYNIHQAYYNNANFQYVWFDASGNLTDVRQVTIPDGYYNVKTLNEFLHSKLYANQHYLTNTETGKVVYHFELIDNATYYSIQLNVYPMTSDISGYALPSGSTWILPSTAATPQFTVQDNGFKNIIGFTPGSYPTTPTSINQSFLSNFTPVIEPVASLNILCNLVNNSLSYPNNLISSFTANNTAFGAMIDVQPSTLLYMNINSGLYSYLEIQLLDQNFRRVPILDSQVNFTISLLRIKKKP